MRECERCGSAVSNRYFRVNSVPDETGTELLFSCPACTPTGETLLSLDDDSHSRRYNKKLEEIKGGTDD